MKKMPDKCIAENCKELLDSLKVCGIYVVAEKDHKVLYYNQRIKEIVPNIEIGTSCNQLWGDSCDNCPIKSLGERAVSRVIYYDDPFGHVVETTATRMMWGDTPAIVLRRYPHVDDINAMHSDKVIIAGQPICSYMIDDDYNIVFYCDNSKQVFPHIQTGEKCYTCIAGRNIPCDNCPKESEYRIGYPNIAGNDTYIANAIPATFSDRRKAFAISVFDSLDRVITNISMDRPSHSIKYVNSHYRDFITGGFNHRGFVYAFNNLKESNADLTEYAIAYVNIKNFKAINAMYGSVAGDNLLRSLYMATHIGDISPKISARKETDHFILLINNKNNDLEKLSKLLKFRWKYNGKEILVSCSCGLYFIEEKDKEIGIEAMIDRAILAEECIEDEYVKPYAIYNDNMGRNYIERAFVLAQYQNAIKNEEFQVYYQPVVSAKTGKIVSAEAVTRWISPKFGVISPVNFVPVLEQYGHISELDQYAYNSIKEFIETRLQSGRPVVPISINLSGMDFYDSLIEDIIDTVESGSIPPNSIRYEITETSYAAFTEQKHSFGDRIHKNGSKISLDDFGSGYSSFGMLQKFDFDILKLDIEFVRKINESEKTRTIIKTVIEMCHLLGIEAVAEGVETEEELEFLKSVDCDYIQGFYFSKPLCQEDFVKYMELNL